MLYIMRLRFNIRITLAAMLLFGNAHAQSVSLHWRQDAQDLIEEGKTASALYMIENVASHLNEESDALKQINNLRYVGELYYKAGKTNMAQQFFTEALTRALQLKPLWKRFSAVISVLELHQKTIENHEGLEDLIQQTLDVSLLTTIARDSGAKEIGRYIKVWDEAATSSQIIHIMKEIRDIRFSAVRYRALMALTKINYLPDETASYAIKPNFPYEAEPMEKFLWQIVMTKLLQSTAGNAEYQESLSRAKQLAQEVGEAQYPKAKSLLRSIAQEN